MARSEITFFGDVFLPEQYDSDVKISDHYIINLESPITSSQKGYPNKVNLKIEHNYLDAVFGKKPIAVCLANNHIMDYGEEGFLDTIRSLNESGIAYFGAGYLDSNCNNPVVIKVSGLSIALMGYVCPSTSPVFAENSQPGVMPIKLAQILQDIETAKANAIDRIIVSLHWGAEEVYLPKLQDVEIAHKILDAGADMVIGHHAHCIQPYEGHNGKHIFYGLGNCIMPNLDVPYDYFDGVPAGRFKKNGHSWNRQGLAVRYEPATNRVTVTGVKFDGARLSATDTKHCRTRPLQRWDGLYQKVFKLSYIRGKIRPFADNYWKNPKLPSLAHLNFIYNLIRSLVKTKIYK